MPAKLVFKTNRLIKFIEITKSNAIDAWMLLKYDSWIKYWDKIFAWKLRTLNSFEVRVNL